MGGKYESLSYLDPNNQRSKIKKRVVWGCRLKTLLRPTKNSGLNIRVRHFLPTLKFTSDKLLCSARLGPHPLKNGSIKVEIMGWKTWLSPPQMTVQMGGSHGSNRFATLTLYGLALYKNCWHFRNSNLYLETSTLLDPKSS